MATKNDIIMILTIREIEENQLYNMMPIVTIYNQINVQPLKYETVLNSLFILYCFLFEYDLQQ